MEIDPRVPRNFQDTRHFGEGEACVNMNRNEDGKTEGTSWTTDPQGRIDVPLNKIQYSELDSSDSCAQPRIESSLMATQEKHPRYISSQVHRSSPQCGITKSMFFSVSVFLFFRRERSEKSHHTGGPQQEADATVTFFLSKLRNKCEDIPLPR